MNKVTEADLTGDIKGFPLHVVQAMCDEQVKQGNKFDPSVFAANSLMGRDNGGFNFLASSLGVDIWREVIVHRRWSLIPQPKPLGHRHAALMKIYATVAQTDPEPWKHFEFRLSDDEEWRTPSYEMMFDRETEYRLRTSRKLHGMDVPCGEVNALPHGTEYFTPSLMPGGGADRGRWSDHPVDYRYLEAGMAFTDRDDAIAMSRAILKILKEEGE